MCLLIKLTILVITTFLLGTVPVRDLIVTFKGSGLYREAGSTVTMIGNNTSYNWPPSSEDISELGSSTVRWDGTWGLSVRLPIGYDFYWQWKVDSGDNSYLDQYTRYVKIYNSSKPLTIYSTFNKNDSKLM